MGTQIIGEFQCHVAEHGSLSLHQQQRRVPLLARSTQPIAGRHTLRLKGPKGRSACGRSSLTGA